MSYHDTQSDFRDKAAKESLQLVEINGNKAFDEFSLCLPTTDSDPESLRRFGYATICRLLLGFLGLLGGVGVFAVHERLNPGDATLNWAVTALAASCSCGGILILLSNLFFQRGYVRRQIGMRYDELTWDSETASPLCVNIENPKTFHKMKFIPEELGFLSLDPHRHLLVIEGVRYRYIIHGKDVRSIRQSAGATTTATSIVYRVGDVVLSIAIQYDSVWHEIKRQTFFARKDALITRIRETLLDSTESIFEE